MANTGLILRPHQQLRLRCLRFLAPGAMFGSGGQRLGTKHFQLTQFEEVFTSHHWMVRKYKLKRQKNRVRGRGKKLNLVKHQKNSGKLVYNPLLRYYFNHLVS
ncbi:unnamed protein product [Brassica napus]|uniref:(rape) hypothetical protein n=1 Tax=Brassica napus TaxID=3708 RepID=A0A816PKR3_BRANA|nr:unnamed protein product [Brassica napus]